MSDSNNSGWRLVAIIFIALAILIGIQFLPLSKWTDGKLSDVSLFSDVIDMDSTHMAAMEKNFEMAVDPVLIEELNKSEVDKSEAGKSEPDKNKVDKSVNNKGKVDTLKTEVAQKTMVAVQPSMINGEVVIEDYTESGNGLKNLRRAIKEGRMARVAVLGDSYIEGDIFTQDVRDQLQKRYGGTGVGYMNLYSEFPGFRGSISQSGGKGWKEFAANDKTYDGKYMSIAQHYYTLNSPTKSSYAGTKKFVSSKKWNKSQFLFFSPSDSKISLTTSSGKREYDVVGSDELQCLTIDEPTELFEVEVSDKSVTAIGVWLTDSRGVNVDCMSSRGYSGLTLSRVNAELTASLNRHVPYDLIVLEYGMNAMSPKQTNYNAYTKKMEEVINHLRSMYPNTDILVMGIGDRGSKFGSEVHSMIGVSHLVSAQREMARRSGTLFFDTREAMGGEDAIVKWVKNGWANKDYIHMNHKGGAQLANRFVNALIKNIDQ